MKTTEIILVFCAFFILLFLIFVGIIYCFNGIFDWKNILLSDFISSILGTLIFIIEFKIKRQE